MRYVYFVTIICNLSMLQAPLDPNTRVAPSEKISGSSELASRSRDLEVVRGLLQLLPELTELKFTHMIPEIQEPKELKIRKLELNKEQRTEIKRLLDKIMQETIEVLGEKFHLHFKEISKAQQGFEAIDLRLVKEAVIEEFTKVSVQQVSETIDSQIRDQLRESIKELVQLLQKVPESICAIARILKLERKMPELTEEERRDAREKIVQEKQELVQQMIGVLEEKTSSELHFNEQQLGELMMLMLEGELMMLMLESCIQKQQRKDGIQSTAAEETEVDLLRQLQVVREREAYLVRQLQAIRQREQL